MLSDSTRNYDRGEKFELYRSIPALRHYLLIEQASSHVEHRRLQTDGSWFTEIKESHDQIIDLSEAGIELQVAQIYEGVEIGSLRPGPPLAKVTSARNLTPSPPR